MLKKLCRLLIIGSSVLTGIIVIALIILGLCKIEINNQTGNPNSFEELPYEESYPYMDYFEQEVYAMALPVQNSNMGMNGGTYNDKYFSAIGVTSLSNIINKDIYDFGGNYSGLTFTAKTGVNVKSVTFTVKVDRACILTGRFFGGYIKEDGSFDQTVHNIGYEYGNCILSDESYGIGMYAGVPMTFTVTSYKEMNSMKLTDKNEKAQDFGQVTEAFNEEPKYKRFNISFSVNKFSSESLTNPDILLAADNFTPEEIDALGINLRIYNVSFDCEMISSSELEIDESLKLDEGFLYEVERGDITITGYNDPRKTVIDIPSVVQIGEIFYNVKKIGANAFRGLDYITKINIPDSIVSIGSRAFAECINLESLVIPLSVTSIGYSIAASCPNLKTMSVPYLSNKGLIGYFDDEKPTNSEAYYKALSHYIPLSLEEVTVIDGEICEAAFKNCKSLVTVNIPKDITTLPNSVFKGCEALKNFNIPDGVKAIEASSFEGCKSLETFNLPDDISIINKSTFKGCTSLKEITIPSSVTEIANYAFDNCINLVNVIFENESKILRIGIGAFNACTSLNSIDLPIGLSKLDTKSFYGCISLQHVTLPGTLTDIGSSVFAECTNIISVNLKEGLTYIAENMFINCSNLEEIILPSTLITIESYAFKGCDKLAAVYNDSTIVITLGKTNNGRVGYYATEVYNKGDWEYVDGVPTPLAKEES